MPTGHRGEKCPPDVIGNAVYADRIATGEIQETCAKPSQPETGSIPRQP